eukprot:Gb_18076 [translate_table: standard]
MSLARKKLNITKPHILCYTLLIFGLLPQKTMQLLNDLCYIVYMISLLLHLSKCGKSIMKNAIQFHNIQYCCLQCHIKENKVDSANSI